MPDHAVEGAPDKRGQHKGWERVAEGKDGFFQGEGRPVGGLSLGVRGN